MARLAICAAVLALAGTARSASAQQTDVIRGRVTGPDSSAAAGVEVRVTSYQGNVTKMAMTDRNGRYTIIFINGEGDYWLDFRKLGFAAKRFELKKIGDEEIMIADARMESTIATLEGVSVTAPRDRALPNRNANPDVSGGERPLATSGVLVPPDQAGNLAAMAAIVAGIQLLPGFDGASDMFSVLGLSGDQNNTTFNGLGSGITALPPDILATTSIRLYPFDPAYGGFSGAQIAIQTLPGTNFSRRAVTNADIPPALEWADATAAAQDQKFTTMRLGGNAAGPLAPDQAFYNVAYNVLRRFNDAHTLANTSPAGLEAAGIAPDSAKHLLGVLGQEGVPASAVGVPSLQTIDQAQLSANFDIMPSSSGTGNSFVLATAASYQRSQPVSRGGLVYATPTHGGEASVWGANVSLVHTNYFWFGILTKTTLGIAASSTSSQPFLRLPEGNVQVASVLDDSSESVKPLFFGGNSMNSTSSTRAEELNNQLSWYSDDNTHTIKITTSLSHDHQTTGASPNAYGTYTFGSLADLAAGNASSFTRTLSPIEQRGSQLIGTASVGDYWRPTPSVQVQYGVRADANRFLTAPAFNQMVEDTFGLNNSSLPNRVYFSPRVGAQWYYGSSPQVAYAPGAARPPRAVIHAGLGVFQNTASSQLIAPAVLATGLPASSRTITCEGAAVPSPNWGAFLGDPSSIPSQCAAGSSGSLFASSAPNVTLFDPAFVQPRSLRGAVDWSGPVADNRYVLGVQAIVSNGLHQMGMVDVNLDSTPRFTLANEGGRPVFVDPGAIVPSTGSVSEAGSRRSAAFQTVTVERSDLGVRATELSLDLKPVTANPYLKWDFTYSLVNVRQKYNGFTSTAGDPFDTFWSASQQGGRHTFLLQWADIPLADVMYLSFALRVSSGQRYTPMIAGDVNGDGLVNDQAFVFDPSQTRDSAVAAAMQALLAHGTPQARACLANQLGRLAGFESCQAPWTEAAGLQIRFNPEKIGLPKRLQITLDVRNPLGIADLALHGANGIRGWGQTIPPDQNLLYIRGFDPTTHEFKYDVNERFGSTRPQQSAFHVLPYVSLTFSLDVGVPRERQLLTQRLDMGRVRPGTRQSADALKLLGTTTIPNPMAMILQQQDSLGLTRRQADSLATLSYAFALFADSVWTPVAEHLAAFGDHYDQADAYRAYQHARERTVDFLLTLVPHVKQVLTASQLRRLPPQLSNYLDERVLRFLRSSTAGDNSAILIR